MGSEVLGQVLAVLMFFGVLGALLLGFPVAFTLGGTALLFAGMALPFGAFDAALVAGLVGRTYDAMTSDVLIAIPLFVFMGMVLQRSKIAEDLLMTMGQAFGRYPGGLAYSVVVVGALLAASTGIVGAVVVTMGLISLPVMLRANYSGSLGGGVIMASGTLAQLLPPSTVLILVGSLIQNANFEAQAARGNFAPTPITVVEIFIGAFIPGLLLVALYLVRVLHAAWRDPAQCPPVKMTEQEARTFRRRILTVLLPPLALIVAVLGSILTGVATATESASVGAVGALVLAGLRRQITIDNLRASCRGTLMMSTMVLTILVGAALFTLVFRGLGGERIVEAALSALPGGAGGATFAVLLLMFVLGFFLDTFEIIFIVVSIFAPVLLKLGVDPIWLAVMMGIVLQTSYLTPPFGFAIFYLQPVARAVPVQALYRGAVPFIFLQLFLAALVWFFPAFATWLPKVMV